MWDVSGNEGSFHAICNGEASGASRLTAASVMWWQPPAAKSRPLRSGYPCTQAAPVKWFHVQVSDGCCDGGGALIWCGPVSRCVLRQPVTARDGPGPNTALSGCKISVRTELVKLAGHRPIQGAAFRETRSKPNAKSGAHKMLTAKPGLSQRCSRLIESGRGRRQEVPPCTQDGTSKKR